MGRIFYTVASLDSSLETMFKRVDEVVRQESGQRQKERQVLLEEESKERERKGKRMSNNNFGELTEPEIAEIAEMAEPVVSASAIDVAPEATCTTAVVEEKEEKKQEEEEEEEKIVVVLPPLAAAITSQPVPVSAPSNEPPIIMISTPTTRRGTESGVVTKRAPARAC